MRGTFQQKETVHIHNTQCYKFYAMDIRSFYSNLRPFKKQIRPKTLRTALIWVNPNELTLDFSKAFTYQVRYVWVSCGAHLDLANNWSDLPKFHPNRLIWSPTKALLGMQICIQLSGQISHRNEMGWNLFFFFFGSRIRIPNWNWLQHCIKKKIASIST